MESGPPSTTPPVHIKASEIKLDAESEKAFLAYLDKHIPVPGADFDFTSILSEIGMLKFEIFIQWWRVALGWNEIAFSA